MFATENIKINEMEHETKQNPVSEIAFDLGTVNSIVAGGGNILVDEPSWLGIETGSFPPKICCKWDKAMNMKGRSIPSIEIIQPMKNDTMLYNSVELLVMDWHWKPRKNVSYLRKRKLELAYLWISLMATALFFAKRSKTLDITMCI